MARPRTTPAAYKLLHEGMIALSEITGHGMRVDRGYLDAAIAEANSQVRAAIVQIANDPIAKTWKRRFREKTDYLTKPAQLAAVVFQDLGFKSKKQTEKGTRDAADDAAFAHVLEELPVLKIIFAAKKIIKGTEYLTAIRRESVQHSDGLYYVHPNFGLNTTITHRSSADAPNVMQMPNRNPIVAEMVRRSYIPRPGNHIGEVDLGQIEARMPVPYTNDPVLKKYVSDPSSDMHKDMAAQIFKCDRSLVSKGMRQLAKGPYVFATFYGSYFGLTAPALWDGVDNPADPAKLTDGTLVRDHLTKLGFKELGDIEHEPAAGTWAAHIRDIDRHFWGERFKVYAEWKREWYEQYLRDGGFQMLTGFAVCIPLNKKQVCNSPIQGSSFHIVLRALPLINAWLKKHKFESRVICEVHDSVNWDGPPSERDDVIDIITYYLTTDVMREWDWINVPIVAEAEICPIDRPWFEKAQLLKGTDGLWTPADAAKWEAKFGSWDLQCNF